MFLPFFTLFCMSSEYGSALVSHLTHVGPWLCTVEGLGPTIYEVTILKF